MTSPESGIFQPRAEKQTPCQTQPPNLNPMGRGRALQLLQKQDRKGYMYGQSAQRRGLMPSSRGRGICSIPKPRCHATGMWTSGDQIGCENWDDEQGMKTPPKFNPCLKGGPPLPFQSPPPCQALPPSPSQPFFASPQGQPRLFTQNHRYSSPRHHNSRAPKRQSWPQAQHRPRFHMNSPRVHPQPLMKMNVMRPRNSNTDMYEQMRISEFEYHNQNRLAYMPPAPKEAHLCDSWAPHEKTDIVQRQRIMNYEDVPRGWVSPPNRQTPPEGAVPRRRVCPPTLDLPPWMNSHDETIDADLPDFVQDEDCCMDFEKTQDLLIMYPALNHSPPPPPSPFQDKKEAILAQHPNNSTTNSTNSFHISTEQSMFEGQNNHRSGKENNVETGQNTPMKRRKVGLNSVSDKENDCNLSRTRVDCTPECSDLCRNSGRRSLGLLNIAASYDDSEDSPCYESPKKPNNLKSGVITLHKGTLAHGAKQDHCNNPVLSDENVIIDRSDQVDRHLMGQPKIEQQDIKNSLGYRPWRKSPTDKVVGETGPVKILRRSLSEECRPIVESSQEWKISEITSRKQLDDQQNESLEDRRNSVLVSARQKEMASLIQPNPDICSPFDLKASQKDNKGNKGIQNPHFRLSESPNSNRTVLLPQAKNIPPPLLTKPIDETVPPLMNTDCFYVPSGDRETQKRLAEVEAARQAPHVAYYVGIKPNSMSATVGTGRMKTPETVSRRRSTPSRWDEVTCVTPTCGGSSTDSTPMTSPVRRPVIKADVKTRISFADVVKSEKAAEDGDVSSSETESDTPVDWFEATPENYEKNIAKKKKVPTATLR